MEQLFSGVFVIFPFLIFGFFVWSVVREYLRIPTLDGFTDDEKAALTRQIIALALDCPLLLLLVLSFVTGRQLIPTPVCLLGSGLSLGYIALTSIINRVSLFRPRGQRVPSRGTPAVIQGAFILVMLLMMAGILFLQRYPIAGLLS